MFLCTLDVAVRSPGKIAAATADGLAAALVRNGQLVGPYVVGRLGHGYRITGIAPLPDSLMGIHHSSEALAIGKRLRDDFAAELELSVEASDEPSLHASSLSAASELFLTSFSPLHGAPVLTDVGLHLPLYLLPVDADVRAQVVAWAAHRQLLQRLEAHSGPLARGAGDAISQPRGAHFDRGKKLAQLIEEATSLPTFYTLYCPIDLVADLSRCPLCDGELEIRVSHEGARLRVCAGCRLAASE